MRVPLDLHILAITVICGLVLLLLHSTVPPSVGTGVLLIIPQFPLLTRMASRKGRLGILGYFVVNELIVVACAGVCLAVRLF